MENKKSTLGNYLLLIVGFTILFVILMMFQSCSSNCNQPTTVVIGGKPPVKVDSTLIEKKQHWNRYYGKLYVKESGMRYVIYSGTNTNDFQIINITKDSLDCVIAKQRLEIINKYK